MRNAIGILLAVAGLLTCSGRASADLIASIQPATQMVQVGETSYFEIFVTGTSPTGDLVSGTSITLEGVDGITYSGVTAETDPGDPPYIFPGSSPTIRTLSPDLFYLDSGATNTITTGEMFTAGRVYFDALAPGMYTINFDPSRSGFLRSDFSDAPTTYLSGTIIVADVPEPSTAILLGLTGVAGFGVNRIRKRRPATGAVA